MWSLLRRFKSKFNSNEIFSYSIIGIFKTSEKYVLLKQRFNK